MRRLLFPRFPWRPDRRRRGGFTLIELLIVIAIISALIAILLPALTKARKQALAIQCESNLRQIGTLLLMYANDNHNWIPVAAQHFPDKTLGPDFMCWSNWLTGVSTGATYKFTVYTRDTSNLFACPSQNPENFNTGSGSYRSYGILYGGVLHNINVNVVWLNNSAGQQHLSQVVQPWSMPLIADTVTYSSSVSSMQFYYFQGNAWANGNSGIHLRHGNLANILFYDGHVEALGQGDCDAMGLKYVVTSDLRALVLP